jgi:phosphatidate cytidylyltransferase
MLKQRVITALVLAVIVLLVIFWVPHTFVKGALALLMLAGAWEWSAFPGFSRNPSRLAYVLGIGAAVAFLWSLGPPEQQPEGVLYAAAAWWLVALLWIGFLPARVNRASAAVAGLFVLVPAWAALVMLHDRQPQWILFLVLLVAAADVGAYFAGRQFGRNKLAPQVSPGKTWEGVIGGLAAAAVMASIGVYWFAVPAVSFVLLCVAVAIASVIGDLTESMFKRHAGLKDSGSLLPGHGGVLDRIDSVTAAAPLFVLGAEQLGIFR